MNRAIWLNECQGFGWDDRLGSGFQAGCEVCVNCKDGQPIRYAACAAEAKAGREKSKKKENIVNENENVEQTGEDNIATALIAKTHPVPRKEKKPKAPKVEKAKRGPSVPTVTAQIFKDAKEPLTMQQINDEITKAKGGGGGRQISWMISFAVALGTLKKEGNAYSLA